METIKVLLVDDQVILLDGLKAILETDDKVKVIDTAASGQEAIASVERHAPDVILMDIRMPGLNGVECTQHIKERNPHIAIIMLTTFDDEEYILDALKYGACGYLLKDISGEKLLQAVKDAYRGDTILPSKIAGKIINRISNKHESKEDKLRKLLGLSEREAQLAVMLSQGFTNKQIATALYISEGTAKNYITSIYRKLDVEGRTFLALKINKLLE